MGGELSILSPVVQYIFAGFCVVLVGHLIWTNKRLLTALTNDLKHIKELLGKLPCERHAEQLRQHEKQLNGLQEED